MKSHRLLLAALGGCLLLGAALWVRCQTDPAPPAPIEATPAGTLPSTGNQLGPQQLPREATATRNPGDAGPARVAPSPTDAERPVALHVRLLTDESTPQPLAAVEVEVTVEVTVGAEATAAMDAAVDAEPECFHALTDATGLAKFDLGRRAGRHALVRTAAHGEGGESVQLAATAEPREIVLFLPCRALVTGSVVDGTGAGVADAELLLLPWSDPDQPLPTPRRIGRSGADGRFEVRLAVGGRIGAQHARYGPSPLYPVKAAGRADPTLPPTNLQLVVRGDAAVWTGCVVDAAGRPVGKARVHSRCIDPTPRGADLPAPPRSTTTAADGSFTASPLAPGTLHYDVRAPGHGVLRGQLTLVAGNNSPIELRLPPPCTVTGIATDRDGLPLEAVRIVANDGSGSVASTRTAADGSFRLDGLPPARLALVARAWAEDRTELQDAADVEVAPTQARTWNPHLQPVAAGRQLRSRLVDRHGQPLAGYQLVARGRGSLAAKARTGADGSFRIGAPGPGAVDLRAYAPGREPNQFADCVWRQLDPTDPPAELRLEPVAFGTVTGRVESASGQALPAKLGVWHEERGEYVEYHGAADGTFRLVAVPPGRISLTCEVAGLPACHRHDVIVAAGTVLEQPTIVMAAGARLAVAVTDPSGAPAAGCELRLLGATGPLVPTDDNGTHRFAAVPAGEFQLQISGHGFAAVVETLTLQPGDDLQRTVRLEVGVMRRVRVSAPPAAGERVTLRVERQGQTASFQTTAAISRATPTGNGSVSFEVWMAPGRYDITATGSPGWSTRSTVPFGTDSSDVTIQLRDTK